tara:strand:+ start:1351 stop:5055 length:3705 start_codon:yes stop_codon:yes gene_type:complete
MIKRLILMFFFLSQVSGKVSKKILQSNEEVLKIRVDILATSESDLYPSRFLIGLPSKKLPKVRVEMLEKTILPFKSQQSIIKNYEWINQQKLKGLQTATLKISSLASKNEYFKTILIEIIFDKDRSGHSIATLEQSNFLEDRILNWNIAKSWSLKKPIKIPKKITSFNGRWVNLKVPEDGIYSIPYSALEFILDDIAEIDPRSISIFTNKNLGRSKSPSFNQTIEDNLIELKIKVNGEEDGIFDPNDKIIFYGRGSSGFDLKDMDYKWNQNLYFKSNNYWIYLPNNSFERGRRINFLDQPNNGILINYGLVNHHIEPDLINLESSGTEWLWNPISNGNSHTVLLNLENPKNGVNFSIKSRFRGNSNNEGIFSQHNLNFTFGSLNGDQIGTNLLWSGSASRTFSESSIDLDLNDGLNIFYVKNISNDIDSYPYIDYFEIQYGRTLDFSNSYHFIPPIIGQNIKFSFNGSSPLNAKLWDVSNPINPSWININNDNFCYINASDSLKLYLLSNEENIIEITDLELFGENNFNSLRNNLIQTDYIIIGPKSFKNESSELINYRDAIYADLETIYREFSAGNKDPLAIRTFLQWTQEEWQSPNPNYLLLIGDAGYDYRNINGFSNIIVPTIQVQAARSYATDDLLSSIYGNIPELATGRFPAKDKNEVSNFIEKVLKIENEPNLGPWRQNITLIADDASRPEPNHGSISTGKSHTLNSEQLSNLVPSSIYINKLYMIEYPEVSDASAYGVIKPEATEALFDYLNYGTAIISYIGHGSPTQLAQEKLLELSRGDLNQIQTGTKLPLWIVGTCSFGHFDDPLTESFSEELIRSKMNAASMVISTSRPITVNGNERYTSELFETIFSQNKPSNKGIGILLQSIKDGTSESQYFHLFGDPAMKIPIPKDSLLISNINPDTLKTLQIGTASMSQSIIQGNGNGFIILTDAAREVNREYEISSEIHNISFKIPGPTLFKGLFSFSNETFNANIRIPKDIAYSNLPSKIAVYIHNHQQEALGFIENIIIIGGEETNDISGPKITFETTSGKKLSEGDHFYLNEKINIKLSDPLGINITNEIGHEIIIFDFKNDVSTNMTNNFFYDLNSITDGLIQYDTDSKKNIDIMVRAWDNANNPSERTITLKGIESGQLKILNIYNYPNPFLTTTQFSFEITKKSDLEIDIFTLSGRKIKHLKYTDANAGFKIVDWNGKDIYGGEIAKGVYLYRIKATSDNSTVSHIGKCAKY